MVTRGIAVPGLLFGYQGLFTPFFSLTHSGRNKMATVCADDIFKRNFVNENVFIVTEISLKVVP